jgi:hypothetical protein
MFLRLAILKRYIELQTLKSGATVEDNTILACCGAACGCLALQPALCLEINVVRLLNSDLRWLCILRVLHVHGVLRIWLLANRGQVHDPVIFALRSRTSHLMGVAAVILAALAK